MKALVNYYFNNFKLIYSLFFVLIALISPNNAIANTTYNIVSGQVTATSTVNLNSSTTVNFYGDGELKADSVANVANIATSTNGIGNLSLSLGSVLIATGYVNAQNQYVSGSIGSSDKNIKTLTFNSGGNLLITGDIFANSITSTNSYNPYFNYNGTIVFGSDNDQSINSQNNIASLSQKLDSFEVRNYSGTVSVNAPELHSQSISVEYSTSRLDMKGNKIYVSKNVDGSGTVFNGDLILNGTKDQDIFANLGTSDNPINLTINQNSTIRNKVTIKGDNNYINNITILPYNNNPESKLEINTNFMVSGNLSGGLITINKKDQNNNSFIVNFIGNNQIIDTEIADTFEAGVNYRLSATINGGNKSDYKITIKKNAYFDNINGSGILNIDNANVNAKGIISSNITEIKSENNSGKITFDASQNQQISNKISNLDVSIKNSGVSSVNKTTTINGDLNIKNFELLQGNAEISGSSNIMSGAVSSNCSRCQIYIMKNISANNLVISDRGVFKINSQAIGNFSGTALIDGQLTIDVNNNVSNGKLITNFLEIKDNSIFHFNYQDANTAITTDTEYVFAEFLNLTANLDKIGVSDNSTANNTKVKIVGNKLYFLNSSSSINSEIINSEEGNSSKTNIIYSTIKIDDFVNSDITKNIDVSDQRISMISKISSESGSFGENLKNELKKINNYQDFSNAMDAIVPIDGAVNQSAIDNFSNQVNKAIFSRFGDANNFEVYDINNYHTSNAEMTSWGQLLFANNNQDKNTNNRAYQTNLTGIINGNEWLIGKENNQESRLGFAFAYGNSKIDRKDASNMNIDINSFRLNLYKHNYNSDRVGLYSENNIAVGINSYSYQRSVNIGSINKKINAKFTGYNYDAKSSIGYNYLSPNGNLYSPYFALNYSQNEQSDYKENGGDELNLKIRNKSYSRIFFNTGIKLSNNIRLFYDQYFIPQISFDWTRNMLRDSGKSKISFVNQTNNQIETNDSKLFSNVFDLGLQFSLKMRNNRSLLSLKYNAQRADGFSANIANIKYQWFF